jgi:hypothetical protein
MKVRVTELVKGGHDVSHDLWFCKKHTPGDDVGLADLEIYLSH